MTNLVPENQQQYGSILTILGENAEQNGKLLNKQVTFTHIAFGDANDTYIQPDRKSQELVNELHRIPVNSVDVLQPTPESVPMLKIEAIVPDDLNDLVIREFAAVATFNDQEHFHAIGNCARIYVPAPINNGNVSNPVTLEMIFVITSADPIVEIDPNVVTASREYVQNNISEADQRLSQTIVDQNGKDWFVKNGFNVIKQPDGYLVSSGAGYVSGNRIDLMHDKLLSAPSKPSFIYIDAFHKRNSSGKQAIEFDFIISDKELDDYDDTSTGRHYVCKIAQVLADGSVTDWRRFSLYETTRRKFNSIPEMINSQTSELGEIVETGVSRFRVVANKTARSIPLACGWFAIALNGIWPVDAGAFVDGVNPDSDAVQYCVDLKAAPVMLNEGEWLFDETVTYYDLSSIRGLSKEGTIVKHPNVSVGFKSDSFDVADKNTTRFEIIHMTILGGWSPNPDGNKIPQSAIYAKGYDYKIHDIDYGEYGDIGIYATSTEPTDLNQATEHIESYITKTKGFKCFQGGVYLESPTDCFIKDSIVIALGDDAWGHTDYSPTAFGIKTGLGAGACIISNSHCYGYLQYPYVAFGGSTRLYDCVGEGGLNGQVYIGIDGVQIQRGRYFSGYKADGTSWRTVNQGIVVAENVKDCKIETDIYFCNEGGVVFLGSGSGGHNIVNSVIYATDKNGAAASPKSIVGAVSLTDTINLRYKPNQYNPMPTGIDSRLTENALKVSTLGRLTLNSTPDKNGDANIFGVERLDVGKYKITFKKPYFDELYIATITPFSPHHVSIDTQETNAIILTVHSLPDFSLSDGAIVNIAIMGMTI